MIFVYVDICITTEQTSTWTY